MASKKHSNFGHNIFQGGESPMVKTQQLLNLLLIFFFFLVIVTLLKRSVKENSMWNGLNKDWVVLELDLVGSNKGPELRHIGLI